MGSEYEVYKKIMKEETKKLLQEIESNPSSGMSHDAKLTRVQVEEILAIDELITEVKELRENLIKYSAAAEREGNRMFVLTVILGFVTVLQLLIAVKQMNLAEEQGVSERIMQVRSVQTAVESCGQNKELKESGLFEISTGKPASCKEVLQAYGSNNSIWSRIKGLFHL